MHDLSFDKLTRAMAELHSRRDTTRLLGGVLLGAPLLGGQIAEAKQRRKTHRKRGHDDKSKPHTTAGHDVGLEGKKKKSTFCLNGQTVTTSNKKKRKQLVSNGATSGPCAPQGAATCSSNAQCSAGSICASGTCQTCAVTCNGDGVACGETLQRRLDQGGTIYVCPGRYVGRFALGASQVVGAGSGDDPETNTILDAQGSGRTLSLAESMTVSLAQMRITGGSLGTVGGGLYAKNCDLTITSCSFEGNRGSYGGGLAVGGGQLQMHDSVVTRNSGQGGGGLAIFSRAKARLTNTRIELNTASGAGAFNVAGGIYLELAELSLSRCEISRNTGEDGGGGVSMHGSSAQLTLDSTTRVVNNTAGATIGGGGILVAYDGKLIVNGAEVEGNTPNDFGHYS